MKAVFDELPGSLQSKLVAAARAEMKKSPDGRLGKVVRAVDYVLAEWSPAAAPFFRSPCGMYFIAINTRYDIDCFRVGDERPFKQCWSVPAAKLSCYEDSKKAEVVNHRESRPSAQRLNRPNDRNSKG